MGREYKRRILVQEPEGSIVVYYLNGEETEEKRFRTEEEYRAFREKITRNYWKKKMEEAYGLRVRDFLHMLKMTREECREAELQGDGVEKALNQAILCVERAYPGIEPRLGSCLDKPMPVGFVRNRLLVLINYYCMGRYGYMKCFDAECEERTPDCPEKCRFRGWEDEYCKMLREAIRCVEVMGTGVPEPPEISLSSEYLR